MKYTVHRPIGHANTPPPVLIIFHGYGADEFDLLPIASHLDPSFLSISIQAPLELGWGSYAWYPLTQTSSGLSGDDEIRKESEEILIYDLPIIIAEEGGDLDQVYLMGFSQGAAMCYSLIARRDIIEHAIIIRAVIVMSGFIPNDVKDSLREKDISDIPFFLSHGSHDELIPVASMYEAKRILEESGAKTFAKVYETGHGLTEETVSDIRNWMNSVVSR